MVLECRSTGCMALVYDGVLYTANVGDSRAVAGIGDNPNHVRPMQLTVDHTLSVRNGWSHELGAHTWRGPDCCVCLEC